MIDISAMSPSQPSIPPEQIAVSLPEFRALSQAVIAHFEQRIAGLEQELATGKVWGSRLVPGRPMWVVH
jgi:hypothetical protein